MPCNKSQEQGNRQGRRTDVIRLAAFIYVSSFVDELTTILCRIEPLNKADAPKMTSTAMVVSVLAGLVALLAAYAYFFGISPAVKRQMEEKALKTMGENKASYLVKGKSSAEAADAMPVRY